MMYGINFAKLLAAQYEPPRHPRYDMCLKRLGKVLDRIDPDYDTSDDTVWIKAELIMLRFMMVWDKRHGALPISRGIA